MSKISVQGTAEKEFAVDMFKISITIHASASSSGEAIVSGKKKTEQFLCLMKDKLGIEAECFKLEADSVRENYGGNPSYLYTKAVSIDIAAELSVLSAMTALLGELTNVSYHVEFDLSDYPEKEKQVIDAAIGNSREKAEIIAASLGKTVTDIDTVQLEYAPSGVYRTAAKAACMDDCAALETMLKNPTKSITKSIAIDWIVE